MMGSGGAILNDFLAQAHNSDGTLKPIGQTQVSGLQNSLDAKLNASQLDSAAAALVTNGSSSTGTALNAAYVPRLNLFDLEWFASTHQPQAGDWWLLEGTAESTTVMITTPNRQYATPFWVPAQMKFDAVSVNITTASGTSMAVHLLADANGDGRPDALVAALGTVATDTTGVKTLTFTARSFSRGYYWFGLRPIDGSPRFPIRVTTSNRQRVLDNQGSVGWTNFNTSQADGDYSAAVPSSPPSIYLRVAA